MRLLAASVMSLVCLAACGSDKVNHIPDGPPVTGSDAPPPPGHGIVNVIVLDPGGAGTPSAGVSVVFIDANGTQVETTDAAGKASADVVDGASVTSVQFENAAFMNTVLDVKHGDTITIGEVNPTSDVVGTFTVNFTLLAPPNNAGYTAFGPCGQQSPSTNPSSVTLTISTICKLDPMDLLVVARDNTTGAFLGFVEKSGVAFTDGGAVDMPATFSAVPTFAATFTDLAGVDSVNAERGAPDNQGFVDNDGTAVGSAASVTISLAGPTATGALLSTDVNPAAAALHGANQVVIQTAPGNTSSSTLDVDAALLPWLVTPVVDIPSGKVTIGTDTSTTSKDAIDLFVFTATYTRPPVLDGGGQQNFVWTVFGPTAGDLTLPAIPAAVGDVNPKAGDTIVEVTAKAFESDGIAGYDAARANPDAAQDVFIRQLRLSPGTTRLRISNAFDPDDLRVDSRRAIPHRVGGGPVLSGRVR